MRNTLYFQTASDRPVRLRHVGLVLLTTSLVAAQSLTARADITNEATATGTYGAGTVTSPMDDAAVPVVPAAPLLAVTKTTAGTVSDTNGDGLVGVGDVITYNYAVQNTGNVTIDDVVPVDTGPTFNNQPAAGIGIPFTFTPVDGVAPGQTVNFTATYTLTATDVTNAAGILAATGDAVENSATATGTPVRGTFPVTGASNTSTAETEIPATSTLTVAKTWAFAPDPDGAGPLTGGDANGNGAADVGDIVVYTYQVENTGNVAITAVNIDDDHEGTVVADSNMSESIVSGTVPGDDPSGVNGTWDTLPAGAIINFTYTHTVTQPEVDEG
jgi:uncharacterized repeat protein (TIGR01451 family)